MTERGIPAERSQIKCNTVNIHDVTVCSLADQWEESHRMLIASTDAKSDVMSHITLFVSADSIDKPCYNVCECCVGTDICKICNLFKVKCLKMKVN